ncbi:AAA family ATPase [Candidatus Woesearchaeota archaeon]|nr:AAA family ATPase [Candidatus Woesearchaeota archaeon]
MSLFKDMLKSGESIFQDTVVLDFDFQPKVLKFRENEQMRFAVAIKPLLQDSNGKNLFVFGTPGVGKTTACKHVLRELEEETEDIFAIYINCWKENTTFKIFTKICEDLGFKFIQQKKTSELFSLIKNKLNKGKAVFIFDEIDKLDDFDFLYTLLEDIYRKSIFLITNEKETYEKIDKRIVSRLGAEFLFFRPYNQEEIKGILEQRKRYAFVSGVWDNEAFNKLAEKTAKVGDVRVGLYLMKESGSLAEEKSHKKIGLMHVDEAIRKADEFQVKSQEGLDEELISILDLIRENNDSKIGSLFEKYQEKGGRVSYKTFTRKIDKLKDGRFISTKQDKLEGGGITTIITYGSEKKLTEF